MTEAMRWFGPGDPVTLRDIRQSGACEVVTALHNIANGDVWPHEAIEARCREIKAAGLKWSVVESLPVVDEIKTRAVGWDRAIEAYCASLTNLAACGLDVVTYNFMPVLDWTRTDIAWSLPDGARALRFEGAAAAAFDLHILCRPSAEAEYDATELAAAEARFQAMDECERRVLQETIIAGLPGSEENFTLDQFRDAIAPYADMDEAVLRANHVAFLQAVCPVADKLGIRLVVHPDDPPFPLFGLPRVVSTQADIETLIEQVPNRSNQLCFCTGSFGARPDNDLPAMLERFADRIGFLHLRSVAREGDRTFHEAAHLEGNADMAALVWAIHRLQQREGRSIVMRPDHGHQLLDDLHRNTLPGYSLLGRMRGLAELRGLERGIAFGAAC